MVPTPRSQNDVFYTRGWTRDRETIVLFYLRREVRLLRWSAGAVSKNEEFIPRFHRVLVSPPLNYTVTVEELRSKLYEWELRYQRFSKLMRHPLARFDPYNKKIHASDWARLLEEKPHWNVYMLEGEENWYLLESCFRDHGEADTSEDDISVSSSAVDSVINAVWGSENSSGSGADGSETDGDGSATDGEEVTQEV